MMTRSRDCRFRLVLIGAIAVAVAGARTARGQEQDPFHAPPDGASRAAPSVTEPGRDLDTPREAGRDADKNPGDSRREPAGGPKAAKATAGVDKDAEPERVVKSLQEWRKLLTPQQFLVTRMKETEPSFTGKYATGHFNGTFACVCCGAPLFDSHHKFDSGTGWPSFWRPIDERALETAMDFSVPSEARVEVTCRRCGAHLGHVFQDGPPPTGLRYCMNSASLVLEPDKSAADPKRKPARSTMLRQGRQPSTTRPSSSRSKPSRPASESPRSQP